MSIIKRKEFKNNEINKVITACDSLTDDFIDNLPDVEPEYSAKHTKYIEKLKREMRKTRLVKRSNEIIKVVLVAAVIFTVSVFGSTQGSSKEYIITSDSEMTSYSVGANKEYLVKDFPDIKYIPEDFTLTDQNLTSVNADISYSNNNGCKFTISKMSIINISSFGNKRFDKNTIQKHDGIDYISYIDSENNRILSFWNDGKYIYKFAGNIDEETAMKIIFNIR